jgi:hypothetical protein
VVRAYAREVCVFVVCVRACGVYVVCACVRGVCMCGVRACVHVCVRACMCARARVCACVRACYVCVRASVSMFLTFSCLNCTQDRQCKYNVILRRIHVTIVSRKAISTYSTRINIPNVFVALVIGHAKGMRHITWSSVTCLDAPYFSTVYHIRHNFEEKFTGHKMCALIPVTNFV